MSERLEALILRLAMSKPGMRRRIAYLIRGLLFYPLLRREERQRSDAAREAADAGAAGDDVYPLF